MATTTSLDDTTAAAIRRALSAAQAGRLADACSAGEDGLAAGGDPGALHALLGMLRARQHDFARALTHLRQAHAARPHDPAIAINLASTLTQQGSYEEALSVASPDLAQLDRSLRLWRLRGFAAQCTEQFEEAVAAYRRVVDAEAGDWESWNNLGNACSALGQTEDAIAALRRAVELEPTVAPARINLARALIEGGADADAETVLHGAAADFPDDPVPLQELHALARRNGRDDDALAFLAEAVRRSPADAGLLVALGHEHGSRLAMQEAEAAYRRAIDVDPVNAAAHVGLAFVFEHEVRTDELDRIEQDAAARDIDAGHRKLIAALAHSRHQRFAEALDCLADVPDDVEPIRRAQLLGQAHDRLGNASAAFASYTRMNDLVAEGPPQPLLHAATLRSHLRGEMEALSPAWIDGLTPSLRSERPNPAFLVGFPRSGTTLLDTLLMGHPDVEVIEERPTLLSAARMLGGVEATAAADQEQLRQAREAYFAEAARHVPLQPGKLLVDKSPLFMNRLPLIQRLFPGAPIILALRHPADVLLSCFVSNFRPNASMANFLRLDTAAEFYDLSFGFWTKARGLLRPDVHEVRYEQMVADPEGTLRPLVEWLGLPWREELLDHRKTASERGLISTASYAQVREPIYTRSAGRWQRYREELAPVLPVLAPWAERFGYELQS